MTSFKASLLATVAIALAGAVPAKAIPVLTSETVLFQSRLGNNTSFANAADYLTNWNSLPPSTAGYGNAIVRDWDWPGQGEVDNHTLIAGGAVLNVAYNYQVTFNLSAASNVAFRIGPDFGFGGAVFLDNTAVAYNPNDMWWNLSFYFTGQTFLFSSLLSAGSHTINVYGQDYCCDGPTAGQYSINGGNFTPFTSITPLPAALPLFAAGLGFLGFVARRRRIKMGAVAA
jgi:hypothetical protein